LCPKGFTAREIFRREIDLSLYDFSNAAVRLVASVKGKFTRKEFWKYGIKRLEAISR
jgi:hypothetical protein